MKLEKEKGNRLSIYQDKTINMKTLGIRNQILVSLLKWLKLKQALQSSKI